MIDGNKIRPRRNPCKRQSGFTLIEVLIATVVLTIGLVGVLSVFAVAIATTQTSQQNLIAKQLANDAMESIFTARNTAQVEWNQIQNVGAGTTPDGIFVTGFQPINDSGVDAIYGTADDAVAAPEVLTQTGPDGILGTADDQTVSLAGYQRKIEIAPVAGTSALRQITITIEYTPRPQFGFKKDYILQGYISQYR